ncbi:polysaccharide deacetylase family protein [Thalassotalea hakodatensis]|uniref:polysaccharide deacetylase family protein n=1 Tax=Thalassotalea hakodatensis TaxID=3030492 RepID=UPI002572D691|nr:polysaccharide deacetylase family protein [Thalassotalea hakodatensis]
MTQNLERWLFGVFSKAVSYKSLGRATILTFHRVSDNNSLFEQEEVGILEFRDKMRLLKKHFNVVSIEELLNANFNGDLKPYTVAITIDDGYEDCYSVITPILDELKLPGAFFITTEGIEQGGLWNDKIANALLLTEQQSIHIDDEEIFIDDDVSRCAAFGKILVKCKYKKLHERSQFIALLNEQCKTEFTDYDFLTEDKIRAMANAGMIIGAHTHSHPILAVEDEQVCITEIKESKDILENITGTSIKHFAYPNGMVGRDFNGKHESMLKELGFESGFSTTWGHFSPDSNRFAIPRFTPWDKNIYRFAFRLVRHSCKKYG